MKINTAAVVAVGVLLFIGGFSAGYLLGRRDSPSDRFLREALEDARRTKPQNEQIQAFEAKQIETAEALHQAFMKKVNRDLKKISDDPPPADPSKTP